MTVAKNSNPVYQSAKFLLSAAKLTQLPEDKGVEVAFVGRSNAGKSSVLNQLTKNKKLARVSKTPGRTQHINLFGLDDDRRLIDLPGYGYAEVPAEVKRQWQKTLDAYLQTRGCLYGLILVMDIRHPLTEFDRNLLEWAYDCELNVHILLNKSDKLSFGAAKKTLLQVEKFLKPMQDRVSCQLFSALKNTGAADLKNLLDDWFSSKHFYEEDK